MKRQFFSRRLVLSACAFQLLLLFLRPAEAKYIGADPARRDPYACAFGCSLPQTQERSDTSTTIGRSQGNLSERLKLSGIIGGMGAGVPFTAVYNTYDADGSRTQVDTVMGYGWTHSYNIFLFDQLGAMFRFDADGGVTRYGATATGGFVAQPGIFETLVKNLDGSFTLTQKDQTSYHFASVPNTPFLVGGPVWMLTSVTDRNGNTTTLTYTAGLLTSITNAYGRSLTLSYNSLNHLASVTDPIGRVTTFHYDSTGRNLASVTDANGAQVQYSYNVLHQLTSKVDRAGRTFTYSYNASFEPVAVEDSAGATPATLSNPNNWATNSATLALYQMRVYLASTATTTDGRGNLWQYRYNTNGYVTQVIAPDGSATSYAYDSNTLMPSSMTDADGHTTTYSYDTEGNLLSKTDALGHTTTYTYEPVFNMLTSMTDPRGRTTTYTYDSHGNRTQETDPLGQTREWTYDSHGNVLSATDKNGNTTTYQYDSSGNQIKTTDPLANVTTLAYDGAGNMLSRTDADGHTTSYHYDGMNRLTKETDALGHSSQTFYDGEGNRTQFIDRNGHSTSYQYDLRQRLVKATDAVGDPETYTYDGDDNRTSLTDRNGHTTTYAYDVQNRLSKVADALGDTTTNAYDGAGNMLTTTDADGRTTTFTYDALNRRATVTDAAGELTQFQYDTGTLPSCSNCGATPGSSLITGQTDANGKVIYNKYDALDRQIDVVRKVGSTSDTITPADAVTTLTFDPVGNRLTLTEPDGNAKTWTYDPDNRIIKEVNAAGDTTITVYDGVGNVTGTTEPNLDVVTNTYDALNRITHVADSAGLIATYSYDNETNRLSYGDGNGNTTSYAYDALNRLVTTTDPLGKATATAYDPVGNPLQTTDRNGEVTTMAYDKINRRISITDALGNTTQSQYDAVGNLTKLTDANSHATQRAYDFVNRLITETYADGTARSYTYDGVGNVLTRTDQIGQVTHYSYNDLYFLVSRTYPSATNDTFTYDLSGRMLSAERGAGFVFFTYDGADRVTLTVQTVLPSPLEFIQYSYNIPGRTRTITYPGGRKITENTDARGRIYYICDAASPNCQTAPSTPFLPMVQYAYDPGNRVINRFYFGPNVTATFRYNPNDWMTFLSHTAGAGQFANSSYAYDNVGNKQYEQKTADTTQSEAYQYDSIYRLVNYAAGTLSGSTVPSPSTQTSYKLDPVGNWTSKTTNAVLQTRVHNSTNELTAINSTTLTYDANGNVLNDGSYTYAYDEEDRLTQITLISGVGCPPCLVGQYRYDALGRRILKNDTLSPAPVHYLYDGARILEEQRADNGFTLATYVYGNDIDEVLNMNRGAGTYYYHQNALGSVEAITDGTGTPVERYAYDAYGFVTVTDGTGWQTNNPGNPVLPNASGTPHSAIGNPWMFTGRQLDEESGLYFYRARSYDPGKGRFLQRDPIGIWSDPGNSGNGYAYVNNDPVSKTDPLGHLQTNLVTISNCGNNANNMESCRYTVTCANGGFGIWTCVGGENACATACFGCTCLGNCDIAVAPTPLTPTPLTPTPLTRGPSGGPVLPGFLEDSDLRCRWTPMDAGCPLHICTINPSLPQCLPVTMSPGLSTSVTAEPSAPIPGPIYCLLHPEDPGCLGDPYPLPLALRLALRSSPPYLQPAAYIEYGPLKGLGISQPTAVRDKTLVVH